MNFPPSARIRNIIFEIDEKDYEELKQFHDVDKVMGDVISIEGNEYKITEINYTPQQGLLGKKYFRSVNSMTVEFSLMHTSKVIKL